MARPRPDSPCPLQGPQYRGRQSQGAWWEQRGTMPSTRSADIQVCLAGAPSTYTEAHEKVTQLVKGGPEDLAVTGSSDRRQFVKSYQEL